VGGVIGTGVFLKTSVMTQQLGSPTLVLLAWLAAGLLSLAGALAYAELGAMFPHAGGGYVFLGKAFGKTTAFLYGWMEFAVATTGGIAAIGAGFAIFLSALIPLGGAWVEQTFYLFGREVSWQFGPAQVVTVAVIVLFSAINCIGVKVGGRVQAVLTGASIAGIAVIITGVFFFSRGASWSHLAVPVGAPQWSGMSAFGAAIMAALWAYHGWYILPMLAGEVSKPHRNVPRGLIIGMLALMIYLLANLSYFYALPLTEVVTANSTTHPQSLPVAAKAAQTFLGSAGTAFISLVLIISVLGALNASILTGARLSFAMAWDGLFFQRLGEVSQKSRVPVGAIIVQGAWSSVLALSGAFDQITTCAIFALWLFYGLTVSAVFVLRRKMPDVERPYKTPGYPLVPTLFILVAAWLVINTITTSPVESVAGLVLIALGLPLYVYFKRKQTRIVEEINNVNAAHTT
jgi:APA family basic amino acid/polyamine antiporter